MCIARADAGHAQLPHGGHLQRGAHQLHQVKHSYDIIYNNL